MYIIYSLKAKVTFAFVNSLDPDQARHNVGPNLNPTVWHSDSIPERLFRRKTWFFQQKYVLFDLILYVPSTIFQLCRDGYSWV